MPLSDYKPLLSNMVGGLAGGALGAGAGYLSTSPDEGETDDDFASRRRSNAGMGAIAGGAIGAAAPSVATAAGNIFGSGTPGLAKRFIVGTASALNPFGDHPVPAAIGGAAVGGAVGSTAGRITNIRTPPKDAITAWKKNLSDVVTNPDTPRIQRGNAVQDLVDAEKALKTYHQGSTMQRWLGTTEAEKTLARLGAPAIRRARIGGRVGAGIGFALPILSSLMTDTPKQ